MKIPYMPPEFQIPEDQHFHTPATGGVDRATPKSQVNPGTLADCLNYEAGLESGYQPLSGLLNYTGRGYTVPKTFLKATVDGSVTYNSKTVADYEPGGIYFIGSYDNVLERTTITAKVRFLYTEEVSGDDIAYFDVVEGNMYAFQSWAGKLQLIQDSTVGGPGAIGEVGASSDGIVLDNDRTEVSVDFDDYDTLHTAIATELATGNTSPTGAGISGLFFFNEDLYAVDGDSGELYTTTGEFELSAAPTWSQVDLGYEVRFDAGEIEPVTFYSREFLEDSLEDQDDVEDIPGNSASSVSTSGAPGTGAGPATDGGGWLEPENANDFTTAGSFAAAYRRFLVTGTKETKILRLKGFNEALSELITSNTASPVGIEVEVKYGFDVDSGVSGTGKMLEAYLTGLGTSNNEANTTSRTANGTLHTVTLGGSTDTWGTTEFSKYKLLEDSFGVDLKFDMTCSSGASSSAPWMVALVEHVKVTVYFENATATIYFWNGASDVSTATLVNVSLTENSFVQGNAEGYMTLYSPSSAGSIVDGLEIRTAASGAGNLIGVTDGAASENTLPTLQEMVDANALMVTKEINFFIDESKEAIYGTTAASPAFHFNGTHFWFIRTPVTAGKDKPRYLVENQNSLVLSFDSGSILVSPPGKPNVFSGVLGATEFGFSERITGLNKLNGTALGIWCAESVHALVGTSVNNYTPQIISANSGALDYTIADMGQPIYTDFRGISNIQASQTYGDFSWGRLTYLIGSYIQNKIQDKTEALSASTDVVCAIPVRNKNQYRLYFRDGYIVTMTMSGADGSQPQMTFQNYGGDSQNTTYVPTAHASMITSKGKEVVAIGTGSGNIYIVDAGNPGIYTSGGVTTYPYRLTFNPFFAGAPFLNINYSEVMIHLKSAGFETFTTKAGVNFLEPDANEDSETITLGSSSNTVNLDLPFNRVSTHLANITDGFTLEITGTANGRPSHIIQALTYKGVPLSDENNSSKTY